MSATGWRDGPAILSQIQVWDGRSRLDFDPPDGGTIMFSTGVWDGIATHHLRADEHEEARVVYGLLDALSRLVERDDDLARDRLYQLARQDNLVQHADALLQELLRQDRFGPEELRPHARWLVRRAAHPEPMKLGVTLLGLSGQASDLDAIKQLARHEEFTLYAAVAAGNLLEDPVDVWWEMARQVHDWGKVHLVERLCERSEDRPTLRRWLLEEGCSNGVLDEYLAYPCAVAGELATALAVGVPTDALLEGACTILKGLMLGGPGPGLAALEDAPSCLRSALTHLLTRCHTLERLELIRLAQDWLESEEAAHWDESLVEDLLTTCRAVLANPIWPERVSSAFQDHGEKFLAWHLSGLVGVDLWAEAFVDLESDPLDSVNYWRLLQTDNSTRREKVFRFAEEHLPLEEIASGPADVLGLGVQYRAHNCLDYLLPVMQVAGDPRWPLLRAALRSPVVRNRGEALKVLKALPRRNWAEGIQELVERLAREDPNPKIRVKAVDLTGK